MDSMTSKCRKKEGNRGAWSAVEDRKLAQVIEAHGAKKWRFLAAKAGLNRCGKSCRLRWLNYLRPNIKRGNISDQEEDLILRLHKLLGNRWSLIAKRLPGRTDNEIKNYWNSHLSKKPKQMEKEARKSLLTAESKLKRTNDLEEESGQLCTSLNVDKELEVNPVEDGCFSYFSEEPLNLEWISKFLEIDENSFGFS